MKKSFYEQDSPLRVATKEVRRKSQDRLVQIQEKQMTDATNKLKKCEQDLFLTEAQLEVTRRKSSDPTYLIVEIFTMIVAVASMIVFIASSRGNLIQQGIISGVMTIIGTLLTIVVAGIRNELEQETVHLEKEVDELRRKRNGAKYRMEQLKNSDSK